MNIGISDYDGYLSKMSNGEMDKLFWVDKLFCDWDTLVDFGCADGYMTNRVQSIFPEKKIIGYDCDERMLMDGRRKYPHLQFTNELPKCDVVFLSSVLHEVVHYSSVEEQQRFWSWLWGSCHTVIIRDMCEDLPIHQTSFNDELAVRNGVDLKMLTEFEEIYGSISTYKNFIHFL